MKFLDGPGRGRSVWADHCGSPAWLCNRLGKRWITFREPDPIYVEAVYKVKGHAPRLDGSALVLYVVKHD